ncbi:MAG: DMT family transporter [Candidatus Pacebacteria bacterium]|nr:DMT family transporter [Candidatus Paceibacterota bacterium]
MTWIVYALLVALFSALRGVSSKKSLRSLDEYVVSWFAFFFSGVYILISFLFIDFPVLGENFWSVLFLDCLLSATAAVLSTKSLLSDMSVSVPMMAFTPLFMLLTSYLMLGEIPSGSGFIGVIFIVFGSYFLNIKKRKDGWTKPFKVLTKEEGPRLMLAAALIWSITANLDKIALQNSSPIFFAMAENILIATFIFPFAYTRMRKQQKEIRKEKTHLAMVGILGTLMVVFQMLAIQDTLVVYVVAIKRLGILISIILGGVIFGEKEIKQKLMGGVIMVIGVLFITIL